MNKILVIDSDEECIASTSTFLVEAGYSVVTASDAATAVAILNDNKLDLILCSQSMLLKSKSPLRGVVLDSDRDHKVILLQEASEKTVSSFKNPIFIGQVKKPFDKKKMLEIISYHINKTGFTSTVNDIDIADYIQILSMNKATKALVIEWESGSGVIVLDKGELVYAKYGELYGDMAFRALLSLQQGKIVDKKLKRIPEKNITQSLQKLLIETSVNKDEKDMAAISSKEDFLIEDTLPPLPEESAYTEQPHNVAKESRTGKRRLILPLAVMLTIGVVGVSAWGLLGNFKGSGTVVEATAIDLKTDKPSPSDYNSQGNQDTSLPDDAQLLPVAIVEGGIKEEVISSPEIKPEIILRLHGSNTVGSSLALNLASNYLAQRLGAEDIQIVEGESAVEKTVTGRIEDKYVGIEIHAHGSSTGFKSLDAGTCDIGMSSRRIRDKEIAALSELGDMTSSSSEHVIALDGIAIIVNKSNPLRSLTVEQVKAVFTGKIGNWKELTGGEFEGIINVYARDDQSGTYDTFKGIVLRKTPLVATASRYESNTKLSDDVAKDRFGIGFTGLPYIRQSKAVAVSDIGTMAILPTFFTVATEDYLLGRRLYLYISENNINPTATDFIDYSLSAPGQVIVNETGFVDLQIRPFSASVNTEKLTIQNREVFEKYVATIKGNQRLSLNFRFRVNSVELDNRALRDLDRMVEFLKKQPMASITLIGFTDSLGQYQHNLKLGMERAMVVANELRTRGLNVSSVVSASEEMPVASNMTDKGREKNRRVEVWIRPGRS